MSDSADQLLHAWKGLLHASIDATFAWCAALKAPMWKRWLLDPADAYAGKCTKVYVGLGKVQVHVPRMQIQVMPDLSISRLVPGEGPLRQPASAAPPTLVKKSDSIYEVDITNLPIGTYVGELRVGGRRPAAFVVFVDDLHPTS